MEGMPSVLGEREKKLIFLFLLLPHFLDPTGSGEVKEILSWGQGNLER